MMEQGLLLRLGAAASLAGHGLLLAVTLLFASVQPYQSASSKPIKVDLVPQRELDRVKTETVEPPQATIPLSPEPAMTQASQQPAAEPVEQAASSPATPPAPRAQQPASAQQTAALPAPQQSPSAQQAAATAAASTPSQQPPPASAPAPLPQAMALPPPMAAPQAPDITERYHVMIGLPEATPGRGSGGQAAEGAKIALSDTEKLREHLRGCASLPNSISAADKIRIVMRAMLSPDGTLAAFPTLIEASASPKGPALMQAAIGALQSCQPYNMLPPDKYKEWRVLDIPFTPLDFKAG